MVVEAAVAAAAAVAAVELATTVEVTAVAAALWTYIRIRMMSIRIGPLTTMQAMHSAVEGATSMMTTVQAMAAVEVVAAVAAHAR